MNYKIYINPEELELVEKTGNEDADVYDLEIKSMIEQVNSLSAVWKGTAANAFCDNFKTYLENMKAIPDTLRKITKIMEYARKGYVENDEEFVREIEKEMMDYERVFRNQ